MLDCDICYHYIYKMNRSFISKVLIGSFLMLLLPFAGWASQTVTSGSSIALYQNNGENGADQNKPQKKQEPVKTVPKSHKQERPTAPSQ